MDGPVFALHPACRVRKEKFGLLFYDSRGPKLLFAETASMLPENYFTDAQVQRRAWESFEALTRQRLTGLFERLKSGGFIREQ